MSMFESGAILIYLASKTGQFLGDNDHEKFGTLQWRMLPMRVIWPMLGQAHYFRIYAPEKIGYAATRYTNETARLFGVMDHQ